MDRFLYFAACYFCLVSPAVAQRNLKEIPIPDPDEELRSFEVAEGFEVNLFAADPQIAKPIQMNFDAQGRLWIATSEVYPHIKPGQKANDKILILEDEDHDGRSDKTTVFADGLMIPTGVLPAFNGAYVANATELLHLKDINQDGRADQSEVVLSGFGTEDTHHILHTFRWGPDGCVYLNQSIYIHSHLETPHGVSRLNGGGIWRFHPGETRLEIFARGWVNPWGHQFDSTGQSFVTDGAGGQGINYLLPGAAYQTAVGVPRILPGLNPGSPKYCGLEIIGGSHLPDEWQGNLITNDFRGHRVCRFEVSDSHAGFKSQQRPDLLRSRHIAFRPIDVQMGPDGAIYIADWYNPIIQHGEVDFRDERRDRTHGRIWRITAKGRKPVPYRNISKLSTTELFAFLHSREPWQRRQARYRLHQLGNGLAADDPQLNYEPIVKQYKQWLSKTQAKNLNSAEALSSQIELLRLAASSTERDIDSLLDEQTLQQLVTSPSHATAFARVLGDLQRKSRRATTFLTKMTDHEHPRVRLEAIRSLAKADDGRVAVVAALRALDAPVDQWLDYALWLTCRETQEDWLPALIRGEFDFHKNAAAMTFAIRAVGSTEAVSAIVNQLNSRELSNVERLTILKVLAELGGPRELQIVLTEAMSTHWTTAQQAELLNALKTAAQRRRVVPAGDKNAVVALFKSDNKTIQGLSFELAGYWKLRSTTDSLRAAVDEKTTSIALKEKALQALVRINPPDLTELLRNLTASGQSAETRKLGIRALAQQNPKLATTTAVKYWGAAEEVDESDTRLFEAILSQKNGPTALTRALQDQQIRADAARIGLRVLDSSGRELPQLSQALMKAGSIQSGPRKLTKEEMASMVAAVRQKGDARRGESVYRRAALNCLTCHAIGGAGGQVGPDLISLGGSAQLDYIINSLLQPNEKVKENYQTLVVATDEGTVVSGIKMRQTNQDLLLRAADGKLITVPLKQIVDQRNGKSLMPAGLTEKLTSQELLDLVRFLSELGKPGGIRVPTGEYARQWSALRPTNEARFLLRRTSHDVVTTARTEFAWQPVYTTTRGTLPVGELPRFGQLRGPRAGEPATSFVRTQFVVNTPGRVLLELPQSDRLRVWLNKTPLAASPNIELSLESGRYQLTFSVTQPANPEETQVELFARFAENANLTGSARFVTNAESISDE